MDDGTDRSKGRQVPLAERLGSRKKNKGQKIERKGLKIKGQEEELSRVTPFGMKGKNVKRVHLAVSTRIPSDSTSRIPTHPLNWEMYSKQNKEACV